VLLDDFGRKKMVKKHSNCISCLDLHILYKCPRPPRLLEKV
jgi:hypothetical protein